MLAMVDKINLLKLERKYNACTYLCFLLEKPNVLVYSSNVETWFFHSPIEEKVLFFNT